MTTGSWGRSDAEVWTCTYRLFRADRSLVYVGVTDDFESRMRNHSRKHWWPEVVAKDVIWFPDRLSALHEESRAIDFENPTYNAREGVSPFAFQPMARRKGERPAAISTRTDKDRYLRALSNGGGRPARITVYGEPAGAIMVSIEWYERAMKMLGTPADMSKLATCAVDLC